MDFEADEISTQDPTLSVCNPPPMVDFNSDEPTFEYEQDGKYIVYTSPITGSISDTCITLQDVMIQPISQKLHIVSFLFLVSGQDITFYQSYTLYMACECAMWCVGKFTDEC